jgi:hypothetical protein
MAVPGQHPNHLARLMNRAREGPAAGFGPDQLVMLEVTGRRTGRTISFPVVVAGYQGERYLVSMLGQDTNGVRNARAAGGRAVLRHGHREVVHLGEVDPGGPRSCAGTSNAPRGPGRTSL